jgi:hypothetical protein
MEAARFLVVVQFAATTPPISVIPKPASSAKNLLAARIENSRFLAR